MYESPRSDHLPWVRPLDWSIALCRWGGFWVAVVLPLVHVPLLVVSGFTAASAPALVALWTVNAVALVLGRGHSPHGPSRSQSRPGGADR